MRYLQIVHVIPGRTRLRCPALRAERENAEQVADALAAVPGVREVKVRLFTGSILVVHDPAIASAAIADAAQRVLGCERVLARGELPPVEGAAPRISKIARVAAAAFREIDRDVLRASKGSVDLGMLVTLGFLGAGASQFAFNSELPLPPWFTLTWWGYRTFVTNEQGAIKSLDEVPENLSANPPGPGSPPVTA